ncbi:MAG: hypothetical protein SFW66_04385 [Gammaproteobacteria bacterium]|nr:hypothetical protein [Gammaproteobacteria bacterium]
MTKYYIACLLMFFANISACWSLPAPKYLSVYHWKHCVHTVTLGTARFVCLPAQKPFHCPTASWEQLTKKHLMESCSSLKN